MAKKTLKKKVSKTKAKTKKGISQVADPVVDSARDIWRAGLGAFAMAQQEGGKVIGQGSAMFEKLVAEGAKLEAEGRKVVDRGTSSVSGAVSSTREEIEGKIEAARKQAEDRWDKLENVFEERVARVMAGLGVPSSDELQKLTNQVESLSKQVAALAKQPKAPAAKAPAKKAAAKKAPAKKSAAPKGKSAAKVTSVYHLVPKDDKWSVHKEGDDQDLSTLDTKRATLDAARKIAQANEPSRLVVHRADGTIQDSFSYGDES